MTSKEVSKVIPKMKNLKILIAFMVVTVFGLALASTASAECGPGFSNKKQLIEVVKQNPSIAHGMRKELLAHPDTGYQADETVLNWLRSPEQKVFAAPTGYQLSYNTECPGGYGEYTSCHGCLLGNMPGKVLLWHCPKTGKCIPILKGYCMNFVCGPPVYKSPPKCKCRKPKKPKCKCHHHKHHHHRPNCKAVGKVTGPAGSCVNQTVTVTPKQECEASNHSSTGCQQTTVTVVANCSNVAVGTSGPVGQGGNCQTGGEQTCVGAGNCIVETPPPPPCGCKPEEPEKPKAPEPPKVEWERIQEVNVNKTRNLCVTVTPTSVVGSVQFAVVDGERSNGGKGVYNASTNKYCVTYTAPSEEPPHVCEEAIASGLPPGTKCDVVHVAVFCNNGAKTVEGKMEIPITDAEGKEEIIW